MRKGGRKRCPTAMIRKSPILPISRSVSSKRRPQPRTNVLNIQAPFCLSGQSVFGQSEGEYRHDLAAQPLAHALFFLKRVSLSKAAAKEY